MTETATPRGDPKATKDPRRSRLLVADDQPFVRKVLAQVLQNAGFSKVEVAASGEEVLDRLNQAERPVDVLLSDIHMKSLSGLHLLQCVRGGQTAAPASLPVLLITSESNELAVGAALMLDVSGFLAKPVRPRELLDKITQALRREFTPKPASAYGLIDLQRVTSLAANAAGAARSGEQPSPPACVSPESTFNVEVPVNDLRVGMVLGEAILGQHGQIMVQKHEQLTERQLEAIRRILREQRKNTLTIRQGQEA